jgi:hypothetical protein
MFDTITGASESRVAAKMGKAEFFAPDMRISPESLSPPEISNLSIKDPFFQHIFSLNQHS